MSFNVDDPLAGILSDGSDDSFFNDDILGKKKPAKTRTTHTMEKKNALFDLDNIDKSKSACNLERKDTLVDIDSKKSPTPHKRSDASRESLKFSQVDPKVNAGTDKINTTKSPAKVKLSASSDKIDILSDLIEPKKDTGKPLEKGKSSQSLLDDILGGPSTKTGSSSQVSRPVTAAKSQEFNIDSILGKGDSKNMSHKSLSSKHSFKEIMERKDDVPVKKTKDSEDWLGIFKGKEEENNYEDDTGMPSWLVGDSKKKKPEDKKPPKPEVAKGKPLETTPIQEEKDEKNAEDTKRDTETTIEFLPKSLPTTNSLPNSNEDITAEGAALYMQQQESQIMVALQLKAQEEKLAALQTRQKENQRVQRQAAQAQHVQLESMLRRQAENRQQMQTIIAAHQERITQRIKALLGTENIDNDEEIPHALEDSESGDRKETTHSREKKQLLQLVQSLQENHDKEIDLMETSYRRQLAFLEVSLTQSEERMKEESDKLVRYYTEKINWMEQHHLLYKKLCEENLTALTERHRTESEMLRKQHLDNIKVLQEHHASLMENIKNSVKHEQTLIQDTASFSSDLTQLVTNVKENKVSCQQLVEKVQSLMENTERKSDSSLQIRETQLNDMFQQLTKERDIFESEKSENRETIKMLEARLRQMTNMVEEESAALRQKKMEFEFDKATFSKQTEFAKTVLKKQDEEMKILRNELDKQYQEKMANIEEQNTKTVKDSATLVRERTTVHSLKQDLERMKAELQAQLEEVSEEKSKLNVDIQQLHMEEQRINVKARELDLLAKTAIEKQALAEKKCFEVEYLQRKYEERIRRLQEHVVSLNAREKQIAREKVTLSRERLALHNERKQIEARQQCSLCKSSQNMPPFFKPCYTMPESMVNSSVTKEYKDSDVTSTMNAIEQEMGHLMGRNLSLRHSIGIGNLTHLSTRIASEYEDKPTEATQVESASFKDYNMDPKFMMLRLDVQKVLNNLSQSKKEHKDLQIDDDDIQN